LLFSKGNFNITHWQIAAKNGNVVVLEKLWECGKELQLKPKELSNKVLFSKDISNITTWHMAAKSGYVKVLEKMWECAKELQLKPED
jgi:ankyrin repeat protein